ncbi:MAG: hypothetical protein K6A80_03145 [Saccharofermentans sp.]|nr:hypothetical protein [Saccharofermentans sp.]
MSKLTNYKNAFETKMDEALSIVNAHIRNGVPDNELLNVISALVYMNPQHLQADYSDELVDSVYLLKYGHAYGLEYAMAYDAIIEREIDAMRHKKDYIRTVRPVTFGVGSGISTWALGFAYAHKEEYSSWFKWSPYSDTGIDLTKWPVIFDTGFDGGVKFYFNKTDIVDYITNHWYGNINVMAFTKVLNELPSDVVDAVIDAIESKARAGCFGGDVYYLLLSHSKSEYDNNTDVQRIAQRLISAINYNGVFEVDDTVPEHFTCNKNSTDPCCKLVPINNGSPINCYGFASYATGRYHYVGDYFFNDTFKISDNINDTTKLLQDYVNVHVPHINFTAIRTTSQIRLQIIRLSRR